MSRGKLTLKRLWVLMVSAFVDMIGFALILPLLPFYARRFGASPLVVGALIGSFAFAQMVTSPLWGRLSDRVGRRPVILCGLGLSAFAFVIFAHADSLALLLLSRLLQGAGAGTLSATTAYVSDSAAPEERAKALGWLTACSSAGVMVGPAIASFTVRFSHAWPGYIAAALCVLNLLFAWRWLPESSGRDRRSTKRPKTSLRRAMLTVLRHPNSPVSVLIWIYACGMMAFMAFAGVIALYLADRFGVTDETVGFFYVGTGGISVIMRALVVGFAVSRLGEARVLRLGLIILGTGFMLSPFASSLLQFLPLVFMIPIGTALLFPSVTSLTSRQAEADEVGQTLGVQQAFGGVSRLLAPIWGGAVYQAVALGAPFWIGGVLVWLAALYSLRLRLPTTTDPEAVEQEAVKDPAPEH